MDKVDKDPQYNSGVTDADKYETMRWMKAYFGLYHSLTDEEKKLIGDDTYPMLEMQAS